MTFSFIQLVSILITMGLYKPWERVVSLLCKKYLRKELPQEVCVACSVTIFMIVSAIITILTK